MTPQRRLLIALAVSVVSGVLIDFAFDLTHGQSFVAGLLTFMIVELAYIIYDVQELHRLALAVHPLLDLWDTGSPLEDWYNVLVLGSMRKSARRLLEHGVEIRELQSIPGIWQRCISYVNTSLDVSSYVASRHWWQKGYAKKTIDEQKRKVEDGVAVCRILVLDDAESLVDKEFENLVRIHLDAGIRLKWVLRATLERDSRINPSLEQLQTHDFGLIDGSILVLHFLTPDRDTKSLTVTRQPELVAAAKSYFSLAKAAAEDISSSSMNVAHGKGRER